MWSGILFAQPSVLTGVARLLDLGAQFTVYNISPTPEIADIRALYADWRAIGEDLAQAASEEKGALRGTSEKQFCLDLRPA